MGSAPSGQNPFARAESILKWRREGKQFIDAAAKKAGGAEGGTYRGHDEALAGAIASAWLALPDDVRETGWPTFALDATTTFQNIDATYSSFFAFARSCARFVLIIIDTISRKKFTSTTTCVTIIGVDSTVLMKNPFSSK